MIESKLEWIGSIPDNWKLIRLCNITKKIYTGRTPVYSNDENENFIVGQKNNQGQYINYDDLKYGEDKFYNERKHEEFLEYGDVLLNTLGTGSVGRVGYWDNREEHKYLTDGHLMVFRSNDLCDSKFLYYALYSQQKKLEDDAVGSTNQAFLTLTNVYKNLIALPELQEQRQIVNFLDEKVKKIDNVIKKTKETIVDYRKYIESKITQIALTGLNRNELKESNIDWIGKIPINWKCESFKNVMEERNEKNNPIQTEERLSLSIDKGITLYAEKTTNLDRFKDDCSQYKLAHKGDLVFNSMNMIVGATGYSNYFGCVSPVYYTYYDNVEDHATSKYYEYVFKTKTVKRVLYSMGKGIMAIDRGDDKINTCRLKISREDLRDFKVPVPPIEEQKEIVKYLNKKCNEIGKLIDSKEAIIKELEQYKKSLIYEYVTGKKEVKANNLLVQDNSKEIKVNCKDNIFAQAILLCKIIEKLSKYNLGRVKAEKTLYLIEKDIGFNFENNYVREAAGPLSEAIYKCESVISKKNKWIKINKVKKHIEYEILADFNKYNKYYEKYYSGYDNQIENIINIIKNYSTDKAEMVATLYASWNDFIIKKEEISDLKIVKDVRENWNDTKKRFDENKWLAILEEMKQIGLKPKGNGNLTMVKEQ